VHLHAAFLPPPALLEQLAELVRAQEPPPPAATGGPEKRGLFGRRQESIEAAVPAAPLLDVVDVSEMAVPITNFGFVPTATARALAQVVSVATSRYQPPRVTFSGGAALVDEDDRYVWAQLRSDDDGVEVMRGIAREVVSAVEPLGLFCDRRMFRDRVPVATINDNTTVEHLEKVLSALEAHTSAWTVTEVSVLRRGIGPWETIAIGEG
jgi:hypothetical protein